MSRTTIRLITAALVALTFTAPALADNEAEARKLFLEAHRLINEEPPAETPPFNPSDKGQLDVLIDARARLQAIIDTYPTSDLGMALITKGEAYGLSLQVLDDEIQKLENYGNIHKCTGNYIAYTDDRCPPYLDHIISQILYDDKDFDKAQAVADAILAKFPQSRRQRYLQTTRITTGTAWFHLKDNTEKALQVLARVTISELSNEEKGLIAYAYRTICEESIQDKNWNNAQTCIDSVTIKDLQADLQKRLDETRQTNGQ